MKRLREIAWGVRWAFRFDNPWEILLTRHFLRRKRTVLVRTGAMQMLIDSESSDAPVLREVWLDGMYDSAIREAAAGSRTFHYLDVGANIGAFDVRVFQLLQPTGCAIAGVAVEMNPAAHARLVLNLELNRLYSVRAINAAVWDRAGEIRVQLEARDTGQRCDEAAADEGWPVPLLPWNELFALASASGPLDLLKIDIEGAEEKVVPQMTASEAEKIRNLVIETHSPAIRARVTEHLTGLGFHRLREEAGAGETHLAFWRQT